MTALSGIMRKLFDTKSILTCEDYVVSREEIFAPRADRPHENTLMKVYVFGEGTP